MLRKTLPFLLALPTLSACTTIEMSKRPINDPESNPSRGA